MTNDERRKEFKMNINHHHVKSRKSEQVFEVVEWESQYHKVIFDLFSKKAKPRITFDINRLFIWAFAKMNSDLIFETVTIREENRREKTKMSVLIFDFCHYKGPHSIEEVLGEVSVESDVGLNKI